MSSSRSLPLAEPSEGLPAEPAPVSLLSKLDPHTVFGDLHEPASGDRLRCLACAHRCCIAVGGRGACGVRFRDAEGLRVPFGYVARRYVRAVETNTVFHLRPGALSLTFGMFGCDLRCPYCHNWKVSQAVREARHEEEPRLVTAAALCDEAEAAGARVLCSAYNEPMITAEWARAVFSEAKQRGLRTALISDGNTTPEALASLRPVTDVFRVDLKAFDDQQYLKLGCKLASVLEAIREAKRLGYWVEIVTLVTPGINADLETLRRMAEFIVELDPNLPWHLNAFMPRYRMTEQRSPNPWFMMSAVGAAYAQGLRFVYSGNLPQTAELSHTRCPDCHRVLIRRDDYKTLENALGAGAACPCGTRIPGLWD